MIMALLERDGVLSAKEKLSIMMLPPKKRARLLWRVAARVREGSKTNLRRQQTPEGQKWQKRKKRRTDRRKLLKGLEPLIVVSDRQSNADRAVVTVKTWGGSMKSSQRKTPAAVIANTHQKGKTQQNTAKKPPPPPKNLSAMCSRKQAKILKQLDFSVWARRVNPDAKEGKRVKPPIKWIAENVTIKEFRRWVHFARDQGQFNSKDSWKIPARRFLGLSRDKYRKAWERAFQGINYGWQVKSQNTRT